MSPAAESADTPAVPPVRSDLQAPLTQQAAASAPAAAPAAEAPAPTPGTARTHVPLPHQLGTPAFALAQAAAEAPDGTSTITVTVAPDDLGPITIRASVSADGTRIEFFSSTDGGREALRQSMPELRREASSSGLSASLDLGSGTPEERRDPARPGNQRFLRSEPEPAPLRGADRPPAGSSTLDLFA